MSSPTFEGQLIIEASQDKENWAQAGPVFSAGGQRTVEINRIEVGTVGRPSCIVVGGCYRLPDRKPRGSWAAIFVVLRANLLALWRAPRDGARKPAAAPQE
jgi:hypothetical protein